MISRAAVPSPPPMFGGLTCVAAVALLWFAAPVAGFGEVGRDLATLAIVLTAGLMLGSAVTRRRLSASLTEISTVTKAIAAGDFSQRVPEHGPCEVASFAHDLNRLTDQLLENQCRLAENVRSLDETNRRLTEMQRELLTAEKMASIGRLAAGVAHEIGNPLGAIFGYAAVQRRRNGDSEAIAGIECEARRIDRIVRDLIEYARPGAGVREQVDVNASIHRVTELLRGQGAIDEVELDLRLAANLPAVLADPHRVDQIFVNLLKNAEAAAPHAGPIVITTGVEAHCGRAPVRERRADDPPGVNYLHLREVRSPSSSPHSPIEPDTPGVTIAVRDSGAGIPPELIDTIFDPFITSKAPGEGTGLGLAIVAATVNELGGRIAVSSSPGEGSTFKIWLPAVPQE